MVGEASFMGVKDPSKLDWFDVCRADRNGVAGLELVLYTKEDSFVCEPLSCPAMASSWVLHKVKDI